MGTLFFIEATAVTVFAPFERGIRFMNLKKSIMLLALVLALVFALFSLVACGEEPVEGPGDETATASDTRLITDSLGREVEIPATVENFIVLGSGAPRLAAYLGIMDMLVGAEEFDTEEIVVLRDYNPVHLESFQGLPIVGPGGGSGENNGFAEEIITLSPDVIIAGFDWEAADELQSQTNIPVVSVRHQTGLAHDSFIDALIVFAEVVDAQDRATELVTFINDAKADLNARTADVAEGDKLSAYPGAVTFNGRRGFQGTFSDFGPLAAINAINVSDESGIEGFFEADLEQILVWNPDVIFLDPGNMDLVNDEYSTNPEYFRSLQAVQDGRVYTMPAFNFAGTNITYAFINSYFAGTVLFPEQFEDIDIEEKAGEILTMFLGENTFEHMRDGGLHYGSITIGQ